VKWFVRPPTRNPRGVYNRRRVSREVNGLSNPQAHSFDSVVWHALCRGMVRAARAALPQRCALCVAPARDALLCRDCAHALARLPAACPRCALPTPGGATCGACLRAPPPYVATAAALVYAFPVDRLLQQLKYGGRLALAEWAAQALVAAIAPAFWRRIDEARPDRLIAVPLAPARQRHRGFNQAREIAARVACAFDLPVADVLQRTRCGPPQASLPWSARVTNVRGMFTVEGDVSGARVALVDDVMTTGATLAEAAGTLIRAGAAEVECWVVARTLPPSGR